MAVRSKWMLDEGPLKFEDAILGIGSFGVACKATCEATLKGHTGQVVGFVHLFDEGLGSYSYGGPIRVWNIADGTHEEIGSDMCRIMSVVMLSDGRFAACSWYGVEDERNADIQVWRGKDEPFTLFKGHCGNIQRLAILPDGYLTSASDDRTIRIWEPDTGLCVRVIDVGRRVNRPVVLSDGRLACGNYSNEIEIVNLM
jgi:WD40 repeat protein